MKVKCGNCGKIWNIKELLYERFFKIYKCPKCKIFTSLIKINKSE